MRENCQRQEVVWKGRSAKCGIGIEKEMEKEEVEEGGAGDESGNHQIPEDWCNFPPISQICHLSKKSAPNNVILPEIKGI